MIFGWEMVHGYNIAFCAILVAVNQLPTLLKCPKLILGSDPGTINSKVSPLQDLTFS